MEFSLRYTPVTGRLHTRYAPVRRSPPGYCYPALPLDLHVLSLPLAFILSQDQTLHCKNCFFYLLDSSPCLTHTLICMTTHAISSFSSVSNNCRSLVFQHPFSGRKRMQKYNHFPNRQNIFSKKFTQKTEHAVNQHQPGQKKSRHRPTATPQNASAPAAGPQKKPPDGQK